MRAQGDLFSLIKKTQARKVRDQGSSGATIAAPKLGDSHGIPGWALAAHWSFESTGRLGPLAVWTHWLLEPFGP